MNNRRGKNAIFTHFAAIAFAAVCAHLIAPADASAQTVLAKSRIGGYSEDIAYVSKGRLKDSIVILDGYEVFAVENSKKPKGAMTKLFDLKIPDINIRPNGITFIESEDSLAVNDVTQPTKLFLFDQNGAFKGSRTIQYLGGYVPQHMEGLGYLPSNSPSFPDHIIVTALDTLNGPSRIEVVRRDGQVVAEISPNWPPPPPSDPDNPIYDTSFIGDVAFLAPNKLLVTFYANVIWTIDFAGNVLSGPQVVAGANGFEGIVQIKDDRIVTVNYPQRLMFFDQNLNRQPESDRNDLIGLNLNTPSGVGWNSDTNQLLVAHDTTLNLMAGIASVPASLTSATPLVDLGAFPLSRRVTYLPAEHLIAVTHASAPRAIELFNANGTFNSLIDLSPPALGQNLGNPGAITYIPTTNEFAVSFSGIGSAVNQAAERRRLRVLSRAGTLVDTIDLTCTGVGGIADFAYFDDPMGGGGRFIILGSGGRVFVTDLGGNPRNAGGGLYREFNSRVKLGLVSPNGITAITTGPFSGAFAAVDNAGGEVVVFRLD